MFFIASKVLWLLVSPIRLCLLLSLVGLLAAFCRRRWGLFLAGFGIVSLAALVFLPVGNLVLRPLEDRFPVLSQTMEPPTGIIVLGGTTEQRIGKARGQIALNETAERLTEAVALSRRYPQARLVFTGGSGSLVHGVELTEAGMVHDLWSQLGVPEDRMTFESRSRNTYENGVFTRDLVHPKAGERWLLVTSAFHMPRSVGIFRKLGMDVTPYPVDFMTSGKPEDFHVPWDDVGPLDCFETAFREWIGLVAYWTTGKSDSPFPAP